MCLQYNPVQWFSAGHKEVANTLLQFSANIKATDKQGWALNARQLSWQPHPWWGAFQHLAVIVCSWVCNDVFNVLKMWKRNEAWRHRCVFVWSLVPIATHLCTWQPGRIGQSLWRFLSKTEQMWDNMLSPCNATTQLGYNNIYFLFLVHYEKQRREHSSSLCLSALPSGKNLYNHQTVTGTIHKRALYMSIVRERWRREVLGWLLLMLNILYALMMTTIQ